MTASSTPGQPSGKSPGGEPPRQSSGQPYGAVRTSYRLGGLDEAQLAPEPTQQFRAWLDEAVAGEYAEPTAMTLATATPDGWPSARTVLLKDVDDGFVFFTNTNSRKAGELDANPRAALVFRWPEAERQVSITGTAARLSEAEADAYFATRPRGSQLGAWASPQSTVIRDRAVLEAAFEKTDAAHAGAVVPRPPHWGGYRVTPETVEFWQGRPNRLHDRLRYVRSEAGWRIERLAP